MSEIISAIKVLAKKSRIDAIKMIDNANSGHIGGSFSCMELLSVLFSQKSEEDEVVISNGHISPAIYSVLGNLGAFNLEDAVNGFRQGSVYQGHPEREVNGVSWGSGILGQGLSVACGFAYAKKVKNENGKVFCLMGDGEQGKGQIQEAVDFACNFNLDNLVVLIDNNGLQASGRTKDINNVKYAQKFKAAKFNVIEIDGHNVEEIISSINNANTKMPTLIVANTVMGKGFSEIENDFHYHGKLLSKEQKERAVDTINLTKDEIQILDKLKFNKSKEYNTKKTLTIKKQVYSGKKSIRAAVGETIYNAIKSNPDNNIQVYSCDLRESLKVDKIAKDFPEHFTECGIAESNATTIAAASSLKGLNSVLTGFGVFNIAENYSQLRTAMINGCKLKLFCSHNGIDVGQDGKTHQFLEYLSMLSNLFGMKILIPIDANQAVDMTMYALNYDGAVAVVYGRSDTDCITQGWENTATQEILKGTDAYIITCGTLVINAINTANQLKEEGISCGVIAVNIPKSIVVKDFENAIKTKVVLIAEEHNTFNGLASLISKAIINQEKQAKIHNIGLDEYCESDSSENLYKLYGLDEKGLYNKIKQIIKEGN